IHYTLGEVHRDPADVAAAEFDLASVDAGADADPEGACPISDRDGGVDRPRRAVEGGEEPVAGCFHLSASVAIELAPHHGVVRVEQIAPAMVTQGGRGARGVDDVGEQYGRQDAIGWPDRASSGYELLDFVEDRFAVAGVEEVVVAS